MPELANTLAWHLYHLQWQGADDECMETLDDSNLRCGEGTTSVFDVLSDVEFSDLSGAFKWLADNDSLIPPGCDQLTVVDSFSRFTDVLYSITGRSTPASDAPSTTAKLTALSYVYICGGIPKPGYLSKEPSAAIADDRLVSAWMVDVVCAEGTPLELASILREIDAVLAKTGSDIFHGREEIQKKLADDA